MLTHRIFFFFFFNDPATTEIYTLSLHDALPISSATPLRAVPEAPPGRSARAVRPARPRHCGSSHSRGARPGREVDRKSTRLNSSHLVISYAVFCLKKKKNETTPTTSFTAHYTAV